MGKEALRRAVDLAGGQTALAAAAAVSQQRIWNWLHRDEKVPAEACLAIERATGGKVSRHELRPDIYPQDDFKAANTAAE